MSIPRSRMNFSDSSVESLRRAREMNSKKSKMKTLSRVAGIVKTCPHFGEWDWCNTNCELYEFCDQISASLRVR